MGYYIYNCYDILPIEFFYYKDLYTIITLLTISICSSRDEAISVVLSMAIHKILYVIVDLNSNSSMSILILNFVFFYFTIYQALKRYNFKSDRYNSKYVYLAFYKPQNLKQYIISLFGSPFAGMASIIKGKVYKLDKGKGVIAAHELDLTHIKKHYVLIRTDCTNNKTGKAVSGLKQSTAYNTELLNMRLNCVKSQKPLLDILGYRYKLKGFLSFLPGIFFKTVYKD